MKVLLFGCGYVGLPLAERWHSAGMQVIAVSRRAERVSSLAERGLETVQADVTRPETLTRLPKVDAIVYAIGYQRGSAYSRRELHLGGLGHLVEAVGSRPERLLFVSSTGVYGDATSEWVDEDSACQPSSESGQALWEAEEYLRRSPWRSATIILRLAGLYGPGRIPRPRDDQPLAEGWINLIHRDDAVSAIDLALREGRPPANYVVSDNHPVERATFRAAVARWFPAPANPRPPEAETIVPGPTPTAAAGNRRASKRVRSDRIQRELGFRPEFPDYLRGLEALARAGKVEGSCGDT